MKIQINDNETYSITLPENPSASEFIEIVDRLNYVRKILGKEQPLDLVPESSSKKQSCGKCGKNKSHLRRGLCLNCYRAEFGLSKTKTKPRNKTKEVRQGKRFGFTRANILKYAKIQKIGTKAQKKALVKKFDMDWTYFSKILFYWKKKYKIMPIELL